MPIRRRPTAHLTSFFALLILFVLAACATGPRVQEGLPLQTAALPAGFSDTLVASLPKPTALAATPDGRLLITSQEGRLYVLKNGQLTLARTLQGICADAERGLLGVAVDPQFAQNRYVYLFYTARLSAADSCPKNSPRSPVNRVVRFTLPDTNIIPNRAPFVLIDNIPSPNANHNGGDLHFGKDGLLYVSVGDGGAAWAAFDEVLGRPHEQRVEARVAGDPDRGRRATQQVTVRRVGAVGHGAVPMVGTDRVHLHPTTPDRGPPIREVDAQNPPTTQPRRVLRRAHHRTTRQHAQ